jgi:hypothetical protein
MAARRVKAARWRLHVPLALLCTYHHRLLHEGGFSIVKEADETLRFVTTNGRTIPLHGCRREDLVDDDAGGTHESPSAEGLCTTTVAERLRKPEVRETRAVYRLKRTEAVTRCGDAWR